MHLLAKRLLGSLVFLSLGLLAVLSMMNCSRSRNQFTALDTLYVLTRNAPTTYYIGSNEEPQGFEYDLLKSFADSMGMIPKFIVKHSIADIFASMETGQYALATAGITKTDERLAQYDFGPTYFKVQQQVVHRRNGPSPDSIPDLIGLDLKVIDESSYTERLLALQQQYPALSWSVTTALSTEELMEKVAAGSLDVTIADANIVSINQRYYPELRVAFPISETQELGWLLNPDIPGLQTALDNWFEGFRDSGNLANIRERYYGHTIIFDYVDLRAFHRRIESLLPRYREYFQTAAADYDLPWPLLAAQAYQESHWRRTARSPTGVRGIMMLTRITAKSLGVANRLDTQKSIRGGARYLRQIMNRLSDAIPERQKIRFALAAYNVGWGHLMDAQRLAERLGKDPNSWNDIAEVLPLLSHKKYYTTLPYGYARGTEPVRYVHRVLNYRDILENEIRMQTMAETE